jgi:hypothetical protein
MKCRYVGGKYMHFMTANNAAYDFLSCGARLVFQVEIIFECRNSKIGFAELNKNCDLKNGVRFEMDQLNHVVVKKAMEEIADWEPKFALEGGEHHDFIGVGCWNVLTGGRAPL